MPALSASNTCGQLKRRLAKNSHNFQVFVDLFLRITYWVSNFGLLYFDYYLTEKWSFLGLTSACIAFSCSVSLISFFIDYKAKFQLEAIDLLPPYCCYRLLLRSLQGLAVVLCLNQFAR